LNPIRPLPDTWQAAVGVRREVLQIEIAFAGTG
jgi:hypothetical protein